MLRIQTEERLGSLIAAGGLIWAVRVATQDLASIWQLTVAPPGPLEICGVGVLVWLHAKWRRSINLV